MTKEELKKAQVIGQAIDGRITVNKEGGRTSTTFHRVESNSLRLPIEKVVRNLAFMQVGEKCPAKKPTHQSLHKL